MVLSGFVLGCHDLGMFWDKFWARFGHVLVDVCNTGIWLEHGKSMVKARRSLGYLELKSETWLDDFTACIRARVCVPRRWYINNVVVVVCRDGSSNELDWLESHLWLFGLYSHRLFGEYQQQATVPRTEKMIRQIHGMKMTCWGLCWLIKTAQSECMHVMVGLFTLEKGGWLVDDDLLTNLLEFSQSEF